MRFVVKANMPVETFNAAVRDGSAGAKLQKILDEIKPEATYFLEDEGERTALMIVDMKDASDLPKIAEPWFLTFEARLHARPAMTPEDLAKAGLDELGKKFA
jgi:hypothetical protein